MTAAFLRSAKADHNVFALLLFCGVLILLPSDALADESLQSSQRPDTSGYTLFDPVPDNMMRGFYTDRPTKSSAPYTVDAGHLQYESDIAAWSYDHYNASRTTSSNLSLVDEVLKAGLTQNTDLEIALSPINVIQSQDRVTGSQNTASGFGDVYARIKYNLLGNDGGTYALALVPYIKAPTAAHNVGNNHWEGGGYLPLTVALPDDWTLSASTEIDILENAALDGVHPGYQNLVNLGHPLFSDKLTGYLEFWSGVNDEAVSSTQYTLDFAVAWAVRDDLQIDSGVNIGLNKAANDFQPYLGLSQKF